MDSHMDATAQAALIAAGDTSPRELAESAIERIEALNPELNAVIHPLFEQALETEAANGPFRGVPILIKDLVCQTAGDPYHEGARFLRDLVWRAEEDSWLARACARPGSCSSARRTRRSSGSCRPPSRWPTGRAATRGAPSIRRVGQVGARLRPWPPAWWRSPTPTTAAARFVSPRRAAGSWG